MKVVINIKIRNEESEYELGPGGWRKVEDKVEINIEEEEIRKLKEENQELKDEVEYYRYKDMTYEDLKKNHLI